MHRAAGRRREFVRHQDVSLEVIVDGDGPAIVLLPSLARDSEDYDEVAEGLAKAGFRVLRPQPRGIGRSTGPMSGISLHDLARDIAEVIKALGDGRAVVVGHAYGNWVARMTAADYPQHVRGVVIAAAAAKSYPPELSAAVTNAGDLALPEAERDPFKPPQKRNEMKDEFGGRVTVTVIPDASHALMPEQPTAVVDALVAWIKSLP